MQRLERGLRATFTGLAGNAVLAAGKFAAGLAGGSHALVADATESLADVVSSLVVWRGLVVASTPPDEDHPYGHGKAEPIAAATVAGMMMAAAAWIIARAVAGIVNPHPSPAPFTLGVLVVVVIVKEGLFRFLLHEGESVMSPALRTDAWHQRSDVYTSLTAAAGIGVALIGGKGYESADDAAAIVAAGIIAWNGAKQLRPAMNDLMDRSPGGAVAERIRRAAVETPGVEAVEKCLVRKMGYEYYVDMHVEVDPGMTVRRSHEIAHQVKDRVKEEVPMVRDVLVHIEPSGQKK
jgi:cation diffusion facilitator family transporter